MSCLVAGENSHLGFQLQPACLAVPSTSFITFDFVSSTRFSSPLPFVAAFLPITVFMSSPLAFLKSSFSLNGALDWILSVFLRYRRLQTPARPRPAHR